MSTNPYFNFYSGKGSREQQLVHDMVAEAIQIYGVDMKYLPRSTQRVDELYQEEVLSSFDTAHNIEMYIENVAGFEGEGEVLSKLGLQVEDEMMLQVSQDRFKKVTGMQRPLEGDLVYLPLSGGLFEIKFVEHEEQFYPVGTLPSFRLRTEAYVWSHEEFDTGIDTIDILDSPPPDFEDENNDEIQSEADSIKDFSEDNPFGDY